MQVRLENPATPDDLGNLFYNRGCNQAQTTSSPSHPTCLNPSLPCKSSDKRIRAPSVVSSTPTLHSP